MVDIVEIYLETGDFHEAVKQSGLPTHIAHLKLIKSGCLKIQDKIQIKIKLKKGLFQKLRERRSMISRKQLIKLNLILVQKMLLKKERNLMTYNQNKKKHLIKSHLVRKH